MCCRFATLLVTLNLIPGNSFAADSAPRLAQTELLSSYASYATTLTPDRRYLCLVQGIASLENAKGGLALVDVATRQVTSSVRFDASGQPMDVVAVKAPDGSVRCYISISKAGAGTQDPNLKSGVAVVRVNGSQLEYETFIDLTLGSDFGPTGVGANPAGTRVYVANRGNFVVHVIDSDPSSQTFNKALSRIGVSGQATAVKVTPDGSRVYVANRSDSTISCIDSAESKLGGTACKNVGTIPVSAGPSFALADIAITPDGKRAYAIYSLGKPCISVVDVDPASPSFNKEISMLGTVGDTLTALALSVDGELLYVTSSKTNELVEIDLQTGKGRQTIPIGASPAEVTFGRSPTTPLSATEPAVAYVTRTSDGRIALVDLEEGAFLRPNEDTRTGDAFSDSRERTADCTITPRDETPNPGEDERLVLTRNGNIIEGYKSSQPDNKFQVILANPHPLTGRFQSATIIPPPQPPASASKSLISRLTKYLAQAAGITPPHRVILDWDSYDPQLRPVGIQVRSEMGNPTNPTVITSRASMLDSDNNGISDAFDIKAIEFLPSVGSVPRLLFDLNGDGNRDYMGVPYNINGYLTFVPLGDTNGDGVPDSPAFDFDHDRKPDPDLPLFPFFAGPISPKASFKLHFAQFGDGRSGSASLFSEILLFNLDTNNPADVKVTLADDQGKPLTVDLNGQTSSERQITVPAGGLRVLRTDGEGPVMSGSVTVTSDRAVGGVVLFGGSTGVAGVGPSFPTAGFSAAVEGQSQAGTNTGIAIVNLEATAATLTLTLVDSNSALVATSELTLPAGGHRALFLHEIDWKGGSPPDFSNFRGLLKVNSSGKLVAATILQTSVNELATMPVGPNYYPTKPVMNGSVPTQAGDLRNNLYFAQFGNGRAGSSQIVSQIQLFNLGQRRAAVRLRFRGDSGALLPLTIGGQPTNGELDLQIPAGGLRVLETDGQGQVLTGSVTAASDEPLAGVILFAGNTGVAGVGTSSVVMRGFEAPIQVNPGDQINTGVAVMNLASSTNDLALSLCSTEGRVLAKAAITLDALGHKALFVNEVQWSPQPGVTLDFSNFSGLLKVAVDEETAATVLQTRRGILATQPVIPSLQ